MTPSFGAHTTTDELLEASTSRAAVFITGVSSGLGLETACLGGAARWSDGARPRQGSVALEPFSDLAIEVVECDRLLASVELRPTR